MLLISEFHNIFNTNLNKLNVQVDIQDNYFLLQQFWPVFNFSIISTNTKLLKIVLGFSTNSKSYNIFFTHVRNVPYRQNCSQRETDPYELSLTKCPLQEKLRNTNIQLGSNWAYLTVKSPEQRHGSLSKAVKSRDRVGNLPPKYHSQIIICLKNSSHS